MSPQRYRFSALCCDVFRGDVFIDKSTVDSVPAGQAVFYRSLFALPIIVAWLFLRA